MTETTEMTDIKDFSWLRFWTSPLAVFVIVISLGLGTMAYTLIRTQRETSARRQAFCEQEKKDNERQIMLWEGVITQSQRQPVLGSVTVEGRKYTVYRAPPNEPQLKVFRDFLHETFPVGECAFSGSSVPRPQSTSTGK